LPVGRTASPCEAAQPSSVTSRQAIRAPRLRLRSSPVAFRLVSPASSSKRGPRSLPRPSASLRSPPSPFVARDAGPFAGSACVSSRGGLLRRPRIHCRLLRCKRFQRSGRSRGVRAERGHAVPILGGRAEYENLRSCAANSISGGHSYLKFRVEECPPPGSRPPCEAAQPSSVTSREAIRAPRLRLPCPAYDSAETQTARRVISPGPFSWIRYAGAAPISAPASSPSGSSPRRTAPT
jgi:hypothetical protein